MKRGTNEISHCSVLRKKGAETFKVPIAAVQSSQITTLHKCPNGYKSSLIQIKVANISM